MGCKSIAIMSVCGMAVVASPVLSNRDSVSIKVVGGSAAQAGDFPFIVSLEEGGGQFCGGTLLNPTTVLTAAHCRDPPSPANLTVRAGSLDRTTGGHVVAVASVTLHPGWTDPLQQTDIAIWKLASPLPNDPAIGFANMAANGTDPVPGSIATVAGWGITDPLAQQDTSPNKLLKTDAPIIPRDVCRGFYKNSTLSLITNDMICAGAATGGRGSCFGDSGGPLIDPRTRDLIGVVSSGGDICAAPDQPGVYARVDSLRPWIVQQLK